jgi:non-specific serine/threonine protein kinase/serine/threonine-protein kinase
MNDAPVTIDSGRRIGPYVLVKKLGQGGMGAVWLAEQHEPVQRTVALKLIREGMDSKAVVARFSSERQALALMQHPAIARVYDAGSTLDGRPYFVMEYIEGVAVTEYCNAHRLSIRQRLELFVKICDGIQHAHQKAILHRDLKPSNVLVTEQDGKPSVKIIDFGLAKAIGTTPEQMVSITMMSEVVGTPRYMSPEQLDFSVDGIDTRTDVYSLGVMLYELLTGTTPHSETRAFDELLSSIRHADVTPPSVRFAKTTAESIEAAEKLGGTPESIRKQLAGDLDWITVKALATDREQRYSSASEFAADIGRHLSDEPVQARRPSTAYRIAKFVRRNRLAVALASLAAMLVVGLAVTMTVQAIRIARERDRANHEAETTRSVVQFMTRMFTVSNPNEVRGNTVTAREILDSASQAIESNLKQSPEIRGQLMYTMSDAYTNLGLFSKAKTLLENAIALESRTIGKENPLTLEAMAALGHTLTSMGQFAAAESLLRTTLDTQARVLGPQDKATLTTRDFLAEVLTHLDKFSELEKLVAETIQLQSKVLGPENGHTLRSERTLSAALLEQKKFAQAETQIKATIAVHDRVFGSDYPGTLYEANLYGLALAGLGRFAAAEKADRDLLETEKRVLGPAHPNTIATLQNLATTLQEQGRPREAIALYRELLDANVFAPGTPALSDLQDDLASALAGDKQFSEAEKLYRLSLALRRRNLPPGHPSIVESLCSVGTVLGYQGRYEEAERLFQEASVEAQKSEGTSALAGAYFHHAAGAMVAGHREQALEFLDKAVGLGLDPVTFDLSKEKDLKPLDGDPRFEALVARMRAPKTN